MGHCDGSPRTRNAYAPGLGTSGYRRGFAFSAMVLFSQELGKKCSQPCQTPSLRCSPLRASLKAVRSAPPPPGFRRWRSVAALAGFMLLVGGLGFGATTRVAAQADEPDQPAAPSGRESERAVSRATSGPFVGLLPQGMVQLVGLTEYPLTKQSRWFQPDGSAAELEPMLVRRNHLRNRGHQRALSFLVRIQSLPPDASPWPAWKLPPAPEWSAESVVDASGRTIPDCHILAAVLPASLATATLRVGFGMGPWETVLKLNPENGSTGSFSRDDKQRTVTLQQAEEVGQPACTSTRVTLRHTVRYPAWEAAAGGNRPLWEGACLFAGWPRG